MTVRLLMPYAGKQTFQLYTGTLAQERALIDAGQADTNLQAATDYASLYGPNVTAPAPTPVTYVRLLVAYAGKQIGQLYTGTLASIRSLIDTGQADTNLQGAVDYSSVYGMPSWLAPTGPRILGSPPAGVVGTAYSWTPTVVSSGT